jgi:hypothetical protein
MQISVPAPAFHFPSAQPLTLGNLFPTSNNWVVSEPPRGPTSFNYEVWRVRHEDYLRGNTTVDRPPPDELFRSFYLASAQLRCFFFSHSFPSSSDLADLNVLN